MALLLRFGGQDTVYVINDTDGHQFEFEKLAQGETWVTRGAFAKVNVTNPTIDPGGTVDRRALASVKPTGVLVLRIHSWPVGEARYHFEWKAEPRCTRSASCYGEPLPLSLIFMTES